MVTYCWVVRLDFFNNLHNFCIFSTPPKKEKSNANLQLQFHLCVAYDSKWLFEMEFFVVNI
jgi:hypothetical protein